MTEKVTGYILLFSGIAVIIFAAFNVVMVFTGQAQPIHIFNFPPVSLDLGVPGTKPAQLISADMLNQTSNIFAHLFLMGFIASIGEKLASIGTSLVRPIVIKAKES